MGTKIVLSIVLIVVVVAISLTCIRVIKQSKVGIIMRLGKFQKVAETGVHFLIPFLDKMAYVIDLREIVIDFPPQPVITKDNVTMQIDTVVYYKVTDPVRYVFEIANPIAAIENLTATTLRNIIGELDLDETLTSRDIINVIKRRYPKVNIKLYPVTVQGDKSAEEICEAIRFFNHMKNVDTLIVGRGGGSIEELWSFNDEMVAREVFNSQIPIISAVGHETDFTICDFVSDMRAPTPSAAAEIATPSLDDINYKLGNIKSRMSKSLTNQIELDQYRLETVFNKINNYLDSYTIKDKVIQLDKIYDKIIFGIENNLKLEDEKLVKIGALLHNLSPLATMDRGYSITQKNGKVINSIKGLKIKDSIDIVLKDGNLECMIDKIENKEG